MSRPYYYDREGMPLSAASPADYREIERLLSDYDYKVVGNTLMPHLGAGARVSTVWLGINHQFGMGPPLIFETTVFGDAGWSNEIDCERYATLEQAKAGHEAMVRKHGGAP